MKKPWMVEGEFKELSSDEISKLEAEQLGAYTADKNKAELDAITKAFDKKIEEAMKNGEESTKEAYDAFKKEMQEKMEKMELGKEFKDSVHKQHADLIKILKDQGVKIASLRSSTNGMTDKEKKDFTQLPKAQQFKYLMEKGMETEEYKNWVHGDLKGVMPKMDAAKVTGLASDHTGEIFVTEPSDNVRVLPRSQPHMRDYLTVGQTDETDITFPEVKDYNDIYTLGAQMLNENEEITDVSFKSDEKTSKVVRMGVSMNVSKRYFRGRSKVIIDHVLAQIPDAMLFMEDVQILNGDGSGTNLSGIITDARKFDLTPKTYAAGDISSIGTYNSGAQTLVKFLNPHGLLAGDTIVIADSTNYDGTHREILLIDDKQIVINEAYQAEATAAWTGTGQSYWYHLKPSGNEFDVLSAAASILTAGLYNANVIFLNPQTVMNIGTLKATDLQYIGVTRDAAGNLSLNQIPIVPLPVVAAGWFLIGDFSAKNIEIREYTPMSIQFLEDVTTNKQNSIVVLADEEFHLVKYNPQWYIYDRFSTAKTQITTP